MNDKPLVDLTGRRILITGASSGIGRSTAVLAASLGAATVLVGRREAELQATLAALPGTAAHQVAVADVGDSAQLDRLLSEVTAGGKLDGLVHAAGICPILPITVFGEEALSAAMRVNVTAFFELMRRLTRRTVANPGFAAVAVSSVSAAAGWSGGSVYAATKGALSAAVRSLAVELAPRGFRVNAVLPSNIRTPMFEANTKAADAAALAEIARRQPLGVGEPEQVAAAICFLLSGAAGFITGVQLPVDGGYLAQ